MTRMPSKFGPYGGQFVPEILMPAVSELESAYLEAQADPAFHAELDGLLRNYVGRPTPLTHAGRLSAAAGRRADLSETRGSGAYRRA